MVLTIESRSGCHWTPRAHHPPSQRAASTKTVVGATLDHQLWGEILLHGETSQQKDPGGERSRHDAEQKSAGRGAGRAGFPQFRCLEGPPSYHDIIFRDRIRDSVITKGGLCCRKRVQFPAPPR